MKYINIGLILFFLFIGFAIPPNAFALKMAKATIKVTGEDGLPIEGAEVYVFRDGLGGVATKGTSSKGKADLNGKYSKTVINYNGYLGYGASKNGYYDSRNKIQFTGVGLGHWTPWNPELKIILRKIENPVPMYARNTQYSNVEIPVLDKDIGFDLIKFDWVAPYGSGEHADFIYHVERKRIVNWKDFDGTLTITFANKLDGIQIHRENLEGGSEFKMPRFAPVAGYEQKIVFHKSREKGDHVIKRNFNYVADDINYFFRVRTKEKDGNLVGMYGKITGHIDFSIVHSKTASIYFKYYLNSDTTRNLEFDLKNNQFTNLDFLETVKTP